MTPLAVRSLPFKKKKPDHAAVLNLHCRAHGLPTPIAEFRFHPTRRWRFDFVFPGKIALEIEGGLYVRGRHVQGAGAEADMLKYNEALCAGWRVIRVSPRQLQTGQAVLWVARAMALNPAHRPLGSAPAAK